MSQGDGLNDTYLTSGCTSDPKRGLELLDGSILSPAIALGHELYHFWLHMELGIIEDSSNYYSTEGKVLKEFEWPVCMELGESVRYDYTGFIGMKNVDDPIYFLNKSPGVYNLDLIYLQVQSGLVSFLNALVSCI